jgi:phenylacetic acid degradation operon negative regulatory protein
MLLGTKPPQLPGWLLVRAGELFGIPEGTTRVALSRMVAAGELDAPGDGRYVLAGKLKERQARQEQGRHPPRTAWNGDWLTAVVTAGGRSAGDRAALRTALATGRLAELREGVWMRPDNLGSRPDGVAHCDWFASRPVDGDHAALAASLWDLDGWSARAAELLGAMRASEHELGDGRPDAIAPCFVLAATALRHLTADPLLPDAALPPGWNGDALRRGYDRFEAALQAALRRWFREQRR